MEAVNEGKEYDVLVRCTNGADVNFSTRVSPGPGLVQVV